MTQDFCKSCVKQASKSFNIFNDLLRSIHVELGLNKHAMYWDFNDFALFFYPIQSSSKVKS